MEEVKTSVIKFLTEYGFQLVGAVVILTIGVLVSRWLGKALMAWLNHQDMEPPVRTLIVRTARLLVIGLTVVLALEKFGVNIAALVAGIGVAGIGVGFALQGVLANVFSGLSIIFTKPFRVGEYIELLGVNGQVSAIDIFSTTLVHSDQSLVVIPNRKIVGEVLHNYGTVRQLDLSVGVAFDTNLDETIRVLREILANNPRVLKEPRPGVGVKLLKDSAISIAINPWVAVADYGAAQAEIYQAILQRFREREITIPLPQHEVRVLTDSLNPPPLKA